MAKFTSTLKKYKWLIALVVVVGAAALFAQEAMYVFRGGYLGADDPWNSKPKMVDGRMVFDAHISRHPRFYSIGQTVKIASQMDVLKMIRDNERKSRNKVEFATFAKQTPVGTPAPNFELQTTDGKTVRLSDKRGKIAVFMFVAMTCPPARTQVDLWAGLTEKYGLDPVDVFFVYSRERHPGERGFRDIKKTKTTEERVSNAQLLAELTDIPIMVDPIDESTLRAYGMVPNAAFVVDEDGYIVFKSQWADVNKIEVVLEQMLAAKRELAAEQST